MSNSPENIFASFYPFESQGSTDGECSSLKCKSEAKNFWINTMKGYCYETNYEQSLDEQSLDECEKIDGFMDNFVNRTGCWPTFDNSGKNIIYICNTTESPTSHKPYKPYKPNKPFVLDKTIKIIIIFIFIFIFIIFCVLLMK